MQYSLPDRARESLARLVEVIASDTLAPTTVTDPVRAVDSHIADALVAVDLPDVQAARSIADLGSGAGIPGLVLAAALPRSEVALVESTGRKCEFIGRAIKLTGISNAVAINERAESWAAGIGVHDLVTARALAPLNVVAEYAAPLLRLGGLLVAWTGRRDFQAEAEAQRAATILGLSFDATIPVTPFSTSEHRHLALMTKRIETPVTYPRRVGVARKRPLGSGGEP